MNVRNVINFYGSAAIQEINDWVNRTGNIIISITPVVSPNNTIFYVVLYEEIE